MSERRAFIGRSLIHDVQHHWNKYNIHRIIFAMNITNITRPYKSVPSRRWNFCHIARVKKKGDSPSRSLPKKIIFSRRRIRKKEKVISREKRARHIFTRNILAICVALFHVTNNVDKLAKLYRFNVAISARRTLSGHQFNWGDINFYPVLSVRLVTSKYRVTRMSYLCVIRRRCTYQCETHLRHSSGSF